MFLVFMMNLIRGIMKTILIIHYIRVSYDLLLLEQYYAYRTDAVSVMTAHLLEILLHTKCLKRVA